MSELAARFVATYWRDQYLAEHAKGEHGYWAIGTHPLACVIAALDGETNPRGLGLPESQDEAFRAALAAEPSAPAGLDVEVESLGAKRERWPAPAGLDVERLARALTAADKVIVDNDLGIVTDTGDIEEVAAAYESDG